MVKIWSVQPVCVSVFMMYCCSCTCGVQPVILWMFCEEECDFHWKTVTTLTSWEIHYKLNLKPGAYSAQQSCEKVYPVVVVDLVTHAHKGTVHPFLVPTCKDEQQTPVSWNFGQTWCRISWRNNDSSPPKRKPSHCDAIWESFENCAASLAHIILNLHRLMISWWFISNDLKSADSVTSEGQDL